MRLQVPWRPCLCRRGGNRCHGGCGGRGADVRDGGRDAGVTVHDGGSCRCASPTDHARGAHGRSRPRRRGQIARTAWPHRRFLRHRWYRRLLHRVRDWLRLHALDISPHSPRAGFVCDALIDGRPEPEIQTDGRWASASSFKVYRDVIGSLSVLAHAESRHLWEAQEYCLHNLPQYFADFPPKSFRRE